MEFKLTNIDPYTCSLEELEQEIEKLEKIKEEYYNLEQSVKIFINSCYGATGSAFFYGYNVDIAEAVTLQGQDMAKYASSRIDEYFLNEWHKDTELHKALGLTYANKIIEKTLTIYMDTDSCAKDSFITIYDNDTIKILSIEEWYMNNINNADAKTIIGHESVNTNSKILNWSSDKNLYFAPVKRIIRHKVTKSKWKLKTKSGKEIIVTNDHSMIVFRNNQKIEIKPKDIIKGDKVLCIK